MDHIDTARPAGDRSTDSAFGWNGELLDLDAYLARIGFQGDLTPTVETLHALQRAHVAKIPFENLEIVLGRPVLLDLDSLQNKMVRRSRGGYCYEHATLFAAALERLGFGVTGLASRVRMGSGKLRAATHALLRVETTDSDQAWLCDVGFGGGPLEPIELTDGAEVKQGGWNLRVQRHAAALGTDEWVLYALRNDGWVDLHGVTLDPQYRVDYEVINHYTSTHPRSPFVGRLFAQWLGPDIWHVLDETTLTTTRPDGSRQSSRLEPREVPKTLEHAFGIVLDANDAANLVGVLEHRQLKG